MESPLGQTGNPERRQTLRHAVLEGVRRRDVYAIGSAFMVLLAGDMGMVIVDQGWDPYADKGRAAVEVVVLTLGSIGAAIKARRDSERLQSAILPEEMPVTQVHAKQIGLEG